MSDDTKNQQFLPSGQHGHETSDVAAFPLTLFLAALVASLVVVALSLGGLLREFTHSADRSDPAPSPLASQRGAPDPPHLQISERDDLLQLRAAEDEKLHRQRWVNQREGIVEISIERAMEIVADRGLPDWPVVPVKDKREE